MSMYYIVYFPQGYRPHYKKISRGGGTYSRANNSACQCIILSRGHQKIVFCANNLRIIVFWVGNDEYSHANNPCVTVGPIFYLNSSFVGGNVVKLLFKLTFVS